MSDLKLLHDCEKQRLVEDTEDESVPQSPLRQPLTLRERLIRHIFPCILLLLSVSILFRKVFVCHHQYHAGKDFTPYFEQEAVEVGDNDNKKVALEAHIMSKCPDAKACLEMLVVPAMEQVYDKVDFRLSYIGSLDPHSDNVQCKHGPSECLGNIIQLCAAHEYPDPINYLPFATCMTSKYRDIPKVELVKSCALEHGIDFDRINDCISQEGEGMDLLRESVKHSQDVHVSTSCTVRVENKVFCVRDGGKWKDCPGGSSVGDLVKEIDELYEQKN